MVYKGIKICMVGFKRQNILDIRVSKTWFTKTNVQNIAKNIIKISNHGLQGHKNHRRFKKTLQFPIFEFKKRQIFKDVFTMTQRCKHISNWT